MTQSTVIGLTFGNNGWEPSVSIRSFTTLTVLDLARTRSQDRSRRRSGASRPRHAHHADNPIGGSLPSAVSGLTSAVLALFDCQLSGPVPPDRDLTTLEVLDAEPTRWTGKLRSPSAI
jgi:hypothetical protein